MEGRHPQLELLEPRPDAVVVELQGEHDLASADSLLDTLSSLLDTHRVVVADLSETLFVDSSTLGALVRADRKARTLGSSSGSSSARSRS